MKPGLPRTLAPVVAVLCAAVAAAAVGYFYDRAETKPPDAETPAASPLILRGVVEAISTDTLTLATDDGSRSLRLSSSTTVESLAPAPLIDLRPGDWVNAGALPHAETIFALSRLVVLPAGSFTAPR